MQTRIATSASRHALALACAVGQVTASHAPMVARTAMALMAMGLPAATAFAQDPAPREAATQGAREPERDRITVTLPEPAAGLLGEGTRAGRMIVFLLADGPAHRDDRPVDAPFYDAPQPAFSCAVDLLEPGKAVTLDDSAVSFPEPLGSLRGSFRVQAVFDRSTSERGHLAAGNLLTAEGRIELSPDRADAVALTLRERIEPQAPPRQQNLRMFELKSAILSRALGREVTMRAGVALPRGWSDPDHRMRIFPAVYVVPGFGGRWTAAEHYARMLASPDTAALLPEAVWIVLDPEAPLGHHGFVDSPANGPWSTALAQELVPALEREFRLAPRPGARAVTGHSSGGWSAVWIQMRHPELFGACFASSPDPLDFSRFQMSDLYRDTSVFCDAEGRERPSFRRPLLAKLDKVLMTVREEVGVERVLGPARDSGEQWDAWAAMWSPLDPATRLPRPMFDAVTGTIDRAVVNGSWSRFDVAALVRADPARWVPIFRERIRLVCGGRDGFYLERGVEGLKDALDEGAKALAARGQMLPEGPGYVQVVPEETHDSMAAAATLRWFREIRAWLENKPG